MEYFKSFGSNSFFIDDLTLIAGKLDLYLSGSIRGNIDILSGTHLSFLSGTIRLDGPITQTISGSGVQGAGGASTVVIDNPMGVILLNGRPFVAGNLELMNGIVTVTDPTWWFTVGGTVTRTNGYINGFLLRYFEAEGPYVFDVGTENGYSPIVVDVTSGAFPEVFLQEQFRQHSQIYLIRQRLSHAIGNYTNRTICRQTLCFIISTRSTSQSRRTNRPLSFKCIEPALRSLEASSTQ